MHFIKTLFLGEIVDSVTHNKFTRYSKGEFGGPIVTIKKAGSSLKISGSVDYIDIIGKIVVSSSFGPFSCSGKIVSKTKGLKDIIGKHLEIGKSKEKVLSVYDVEKKEECEKEGLLSLYEELENEYLLLGITSSDRKFSLKPKKNLPKSGKQDSAFFSATLDTSALPKIVEEIAFDVKGTDFKELTISHTYVIKEMIVPEEYKSDFKEARVRAKRKGIIKRVVEIDGKKTEHEHDMLI